MADTNQDFTTFSGDDVAPIYTVLDAAGLPVSLAGVLEITWKAWRNRDAGQVAVISKTKSGGQIAIIGNAANGQFQVTISKTDTAPLTMAYYYEAAVTDQNSNVTTVTTGQITVKPKPIGTYSGDPSLSNRDYVRTLVNDTDPDNLLFTDQVYDKLLSSIGGPYYVAAQICRMLAQRFSSKASKRIGDMSIQYGEVAKNYTSMANEYQAMADRTGGVIAFAGGISKSDMQSRTQDCDNVGAFTTMEDFTNKGGSYGGYMPTNTGGDDC